ncbi:hypothetical protein [Fimbriimonas ginsengisoli]|nr:hypothetical protein [Fimbriimonas ginsengisoli]
MSQRQPGLLRDFDSELSALARRVLGDDVDALFRDMELRNDVK